MNLATQLRNSEQDRLLIINCEDYGLSPSFNEGIEQLLQAKFVSSATLMLPCAYARAAAIWSANHPQVDIGIHFTFTSEWDTYKWGPVTRHADVSTLVSNEGYFFSDCASF